MGAFEDRRTVVGDDLSRVDSPRFASYATLRRGIAYECGYAEWCAWMADTLERGRPTEE